ncbi:MAG: hypothetical protein ACKV2O_07890 [Acidimicrobiales bacterium]
MNYDISNACLGFLNGIHLAGVMIHSGQIDYALIVDAEGTREFYDNTIARPPARRTGAGNTTGTHLHRGLPGTTPSQRTAIMSDLR